jgi:hypothetical protein
VEALDTFRNAPGSCPYDEAFYDGQVAESLQSARPMLGFLYQHYAPASVVDVGCGRGAWLKVCCELGSRLAHGFDGRWNRQEHMLDPRIAFTPVDLEEQIPHGYSYDLAISLEVAEHLRPQCAAAFVAALSRLSDVVLFSAAIPGQGGTNHVNERYPSYWGSLFSSHGYAIFDAFRPTFWSDARISSYYRQNTFLYVRRAHALATRLRESSVPELADTRFMDCVHPAIFESKLRDLSVPRTTMGVREHLRDLLPSIVRGVSRRLRA